MSLMMKKTLAIAVDVAKGRSTMKNRGKSKPRQAPGETTALENSPTPATERTSPGGAVLI